MFSKPKTFFFYLKKLSLTYIQFKLEIREKYKISPCDLLDLQCTPCGIKTNLKVPMVCKTKQFSPYR